MRMLNKHAPMKQKLVRGNNSPFMNVEIFYVTVKVEKQFKQKSIS